ncbi:hypothetical protein VOLCADRAFT_105976 [Volvox carteri f. nagariensis]|uniref:Phosphate transporter n=1 Tax=Volvox carteri f. nagariensis TaxID=3068 RepID=D8U430_VOLCA|nr:uncharacterized protein VOLCADRAFT_105976 [Volvox carteri f. nagariensis]EFJ45522.1 hypothetical protein VOLCADRAFT_105976 [Volvox carteri f. nagariensis]|eukprot:XP_002953549.1 hypothetical protein VOLCADRAFT_105976 [Volvox carteri f. nagariensis]
MATHCTAEAPSGKVHVCFVAVGGKDSLKPRIGELLLPFPKWMCTCQDAASSRGRHLQGRYCCRLAAEQTAVRKGAPLLVKVYFSPHSFVFTFSAAYFLVHAMFGANDVANAFGSSVAARTLTMRQALLIASVCEFSGSVLLGTEVTLTVAGGIARLSAFDSEPEIYMYGMLCAVVASGAWLLLATYLSLPVSTTHSTIGGVLGFAFVYGGSSAVTWLEPQDTFPYMGGLVPIILAWFTSPLMSGLASVVLFVIVRAAVLRRVRSLELAIWSLPVLVLVTVFINLFFVLYKVWGCGGFKTGSCGPRRAILLRYVFSTGLGCLVKDEGESGAVRGRGSEARLAWTSQRCAWVSSVAAGGCALVTGLLGVPYMKRHVEAAAQASWLSVWLMGWWVRCRSLNSSSRLELTGTRPSSPSAPTTGALPRMSVARNSQAGGGGGGSGGGGGGGGNGPWRAGAGRGMTAGLSVLPAVAPGAAFVDARGHVAAGRTGYGTRSFSRSTARFSEASQSSRQGSGTPDTVAPAASEMATAQIPLPTPQPPPQLSAHTTQSPPPLVNRGGSLPLESVPESSVYGAREPSVQPPLQSEAPSGAAAVAAAGPVGPVVALHVPSAVRLLRATSTTTAAAAAAATTSSPSSSPQRARPSNSRFTPLVGDLPTPTPDLSVPVPGELGDYTVPQQQQYEGHVSRDSGAMGPEVAGQHRALPMQQEKEAGEEEEKGRAEGEEEAEDEAEGNGQQQQQPRPFHSQQQHQQHWQFQQQLLSEWWMQQQLAGQPEPQQQYLQPTVQTSTPDFQGGDGVTAGAAGAPGHWVTHAPSAAPAAGAIAVGRTTDCTAGRPIAEGIEDDGEERGHSSGSYRHQFEPAERSGGRAAADATTAAAPVRAAGGGMPIPAPGDPETLGASETSSSLSSSSTDQEQSFAGEHHRAQQQQQQAGGGHSSNNAQFQKTFDQLKDIVLRGTDVNVHDCVELGLDPVAAAIHAHAEVFDPSTEHAFKYLQVVTAICDSFSHGANDVANSVGPLAAIWQIYRYRRVDYDSTVPLWVLVIGGAGIVVGLATYGYNIIRAIGVRLSAVTPSRGFCIELSTALVVVLASKYGLPISTTHCQVGATAGMGLLEGSAGLNWSLAAQFFAGWVVTLLLTALMSAALFAAGAYAPSITQSRDIETYQTHLSALASRLDLLLNKTNAAAVLDSATWGNYSASLQSQLHADLATLQQIAAEGSDVATRPVQHMAASYVVDFISRTVEMYVNNSLPYIGGMQAAGQVLPRRP